MHTIFQVLAPRGSEPAVSNNETRSEDGPQIVESIRVPGSLAAAFGALPQAELSPDLRAEAFRDQAATLEAPRLVDFTHVDRRAAESLFMPVPFFYGHLRFHPKGNPHPAVVPFAYPLGHPDHQHEPAGMRFTAGEAVVPGHSDSIAGLMSQVEGYDRTDGTVAAAYMLAYMDAILQIYERVPGAWEQMLDAQNQVFADQNQMRYISATRYIVDDLARAPAERLGLGNQGDRLFDVAVVAQRLRDETHAARDLLHSGQALSPEQLSRIATLAEIGANNIDMLGLLAYMQASLNSRAS